MDDPDKSPTNPNREYLAAGMKFLKPCEILPHELIPDHDNWLAIVNVPLERVTVNIISIHGELGVHLFRFVKRIGRDFETCNETDSPLHRRATCGIT